MQGIVTSDLLVLVLKLLLLLVVLQAVDSKRHKWGKAWNQ